MFGFFRKKKAKDEFGFITYFKVNHPLDIPYENDLKGKPTNDPEIQAELNRMVDLACEGALPAKLQAVMLSDSGDPYNQSELGYVFGCLDVYKSKLWGVEDFNRSFFHCGFRSYYGNMDAARTALIGLGMAIANSHPEFMQASKIGWSDAYKMITEKTQPSGLMTLLSEQN